MNAVPPLQPSPVDLIVEPSGASTFNKKCGESGQLPHGVVAYALITWPAAPRNVKRAFCPGVPIETVPARSFTVISVASYRVTVTEPVVAPGGLTMSM